MPHITIAMWPGYDPEIKKNVARKVQETVAQEMGKDKKAVSVSITEVPKEEWPDYMSRIPEESMVIGRE